MMARVRGETALTCMSLFFPFLMNSLRLHSQYTVAQHDGSAWGPSVCLDVKNYFFFLITQELAGIKAESSERCCSSRRVSMPFFNLLSSAALLCKRASQKVASFLHFFHDQCCDAKQIISEFQPGIHQTHNAFPTVNAHTQSEMFFNLLSAPWVYRGQTQGSPTAIM